MKISDVFRKRALFGVAIFCITAIATVGALSIGGNDEGDEPKSLVDLNEKEPSGENQQLAGMTGSEQPEVKEPEQTADNTGVVTQPEVKEPEQTADNTGVVTQPEVKEPEQTADNTGNDTQPEVKEPAQVADKEDTEPAVVAKEPEQTEVLSPQLIAEQLNFDKASGLLWPLQGNVLIPYSPDHGVWNKTLEQFSTSEAIVLSAEVGSEVKASAKGVVTSIEEDVRTGTTITLALGNNTSIVYGQLEVENLKEGDVIEAGECLGTVAEPTRYYVVEGPNLYFKVLEGESAIDPTELLKAE